MVRRSTGVTSISVGQVAPTICPAHYPALTTRRDQGGKCERSVRRFSGDRMGAADRDAAENRLRPGAPVAAAVGDWFERRRRYGELLGPMAARCADNDGSAASISPEISQI
jgi:hypothetical protein